MRSFFKRWSWLALAVPSFWALFLTFAETREMSCPIYTLETPKINQALRFLLISDLHSCFYGEGQKDLVSRIQQLNPDLIVMTGDIADDDMPHEGTTQLISQIAPHYPCYYVSGNHEFLSGEMLQMKRWLRAHHVTVFEGTGLTVDIGSDTIFLCGIDDPKVGASAYSKQLEQVGSLLQRHSEYYTILLSHRPERIPDYAAFSPDLVLAGHAHGGQWRIPGLVNGLLAPHQGFFPQYAGGLYLFKQTSMIVSRGLAKDSTRLPRIFNPPELVVVDLLPSATY